jgi:biopolymer transport protein ExbD
MRPQSRTALNAEINVTPLVDVCLVLLIIFMVVTPIIVTGIPVALPTVQSPEPLAQQPLQITVKADGVLYIGQGAVRVEEATAALQRARADADHPIVVQADKTVPYGQVAEILSHCRAAGFSSVGLVARRNDEPGG